MKVLFGGLGLFVRQRTCKASP
ncbi:hypothetical protein MexAM1_META1p0365 [Methylorubrum extorquens AM1]|uniref:Uncharacterized protein n=1 Tax=Methylorubrum extorquens (strain ATCC 14718 / DSM 1338 / JCM 2805 / NCIMB 9133 / AM1) TaxID=272630 RepID=C5AS78_METEA|nr:hypothetical protein MexAM1_META1p0365 [Methylorubrum extorquens AM1]